MDTKILSMRRFISLVLVFLFVTRPFQILAQASIVKVAEGTALTIRPPYDIRSDKAKSGDVVEFLVVRPIQVNGVTIIEARAKVSVTITEAKHAAGFGQSGKLKISVNSVQAVDGTKIRLRGSPTSSGGGNTAVSVVGTIFLSVLFVFLQGREAVLKADQELTVFVDEAKDFAVMPATTRPQAAGNTTAVAVERPQVIAVQPAGVVLLPVASTAVSPLPSSSSAPPAAASSPQVVVAATITPHPVPTPSRPAAVAPPLTLPPMSPPTVPAPTSTVSASSPVQIAGAVEKHFVCKKISQVGQPLKVTDCFGANVTTISTWFEVPAELGARVYEIRWYYSDQLKRVSTFIIRKGQTHGWAMMHRTAKTSFARGQWRTEIWKDGQVLSRRDFAVTF